MILVAGGSGTLGTLLVRRLRARDLPVRVLTRDVGRVAHLDREQVEVVEGDVREPASLGRAVEGVDTVVSAVHGFAGPDGVSPASVDRDGNVHLVDAAASVGADVLLMSVVGASPDNEMELFRMKHAAEEYLRSRSTAWTIVRSTAFLETWTGILEQTAGRSGRPLVFGRGDNPINFVSAADVSVLLERVVTDRATRGQVLEIGGPADLTLRQLAGSVQAAAGRRGEPRHVPRPVLRVMAVAMGPVRPEIARQARAALALDQADLAFDAGPIHRAYPEVPSTSVAELLASRPAGR